MLNRLPRRQAAEMTGRVAHGKALPAEVVEQPEPPSALDWAQQSVDGIDTVTRLRHDRALMPSERGPLRRLARGMPTRHPSQPYPNSSCGACPALVPEAWRHAGPGVGVRGGSAALCWTGMHYPGAAWLLAGATPSSLPHRDVVCQLGA